MKQNYITVILCIAITFISLVRPTGGLFYESLQGTKVCRYNWHSAGFRGPTISNAEIYMYFSNKIYGNNFFYSTRRLLRFEITKMLIADLKKNKFIVLIIIIFRFFAHFRSYFLGLSFATVCTLLVLQISVLRFEST